MAGILDLLSPALTVAAQSAGTANAANTQRALQDAAAKRQAEQDAVKMQIAQQQMHSQNIEDVLRQAQAGKIQYEIEHPKPVRDPYGEGALDFRKQVIDYQQAHSAPSRSVDADPVLAKRKFLLTTIPGLMKPIKAAYGNTMKPGMTREAAVQRANELWSAANGEEVAPAPLSRAPAGPDPRQGQFDQEAKTYQEVVAKIDASALPDAEKAARKAKARERYNARVQSVVGDITL